MEVITPFCSVRSESDSLAKGGNWQQQAYLHIYTLYFHLPPPPPGIHPSFNSPLSGGNSLLILKRLSWTRRSQLLHYRERTNFGKEECFKNLCLGISPITSSPLLTSAKHLPPLLREGGVPNGRGGRQHYTL